MKQKAKSHISSSMCSYFIFHRSKFLSEGGYVSNINYLKKLSLVSLLSFEVHKIIKLILLMVKTWNTWEMIVFQWH